jgi:hypothetical protein
MRKKELYLTKPRVDCSHQRIKKHRHDVVVRHSPHVFCMFSLILMCCLCVLLSVDGRCLRQSDTVFFPLFLCCLRLSVSFVQSDLSQRQSIYICVSVCLSVDRSFVGFGQLASC